MLKNKKLLFTILIIALLLLIPNIVKATTITRIDITLPEPIVGKNPAGSSDVTVKGTDENGATVNMEIENVGWEADAGEGPYINEGAFAIIPTYMGQVCFNHSNQYELPWESGTGFDTSVFSLYLNGKQITGLDSRNYLIPMVSTENPVRWCFEYNFGKAKFEQYLSSIEVTIPGTGAGDPRGTASTIIVKGNGKTGFVISNVQWKKYNPNTKTYENFTGSTLEEDTEYSVGVWFEIPYKYGINSSTVVKVNGVTFAMPGDEAFEFGLAGDEDGYEARLVYHFNTSDPIYYSILEGKDPIYTVGKDKTLTFKIDAPLNKFMGIFIGDNEIAPKNYEVTEGSTVVTFKEDYLKSLSAGRYELMFLYSDGYAISDLTIAGTGTGTGSGSGSGTLPSTDPTKAPGRIPYAGGTIIMILSSTLFVIAGAYAFKKTRDLKGI